MRGKKRFISKSLIILLAIFLSVVTVIGLSKIIFKEMQNEQEMMKNYESKKEKCQLLKDIGKESIQEGVGIDTRMIVNDEVQYQIYNDNNNIIFYYYLQDDSETYNATITLSNEYRIIKEEYSVEIESLDEYIKSYNSGNRFLSVMYGIIVVLLIYIVICVLILIIPILKQIDLGHGWRYTKYRLTAKELYKQVMAESKSDYNWTVPARELVRICKKISFPKNYAIDIKIAILNLFANLENRQICGGDRYINNPADEKAVQYSYNSLYKCDKEEAIEARKRYLNEKIKTASFVSRCDLLYHPDPTFRRIQEEWRKAKFEEYISKRKIDFKRLDKVLKSSFTELIKTAESNGEFKEDDKIAKEIITKLFKIN